MVPHAEQQQQAEMFITYHGLELCANDYNSNPARGLLQTNAVHDLFQVPFRKPHFLVINGVSNSTVQPLHQLLLTQGDGATDWDAETVRWRGVIDSVQAPLPQITNLRLETNGVLRFNFPGQRGRTNQVQRTPDFANWTVLTNVFGTNAPILFRDTGASGNAGRFYRVRRL